MDPRSTYVARLTGSGSGSDEHEHEHEPYEAGVSKKWLQSPDLDAVLGSLPQFLSSPIAAGLCSRIKSETEAALHARLREELSAAERQIPRPELAPQSFRDFVASCAVNGALFAAWVCAWNIIIEASRDVAQSRRALQIAACSSNSVLDELLGPGPAGPWTTNKYGPSNASHEMPALFQRTERDELLSTLKSVLCNVFDLLQVRLSPVSRAWAWGRLDDGVVSESDKEGWKRALAPAAKEEFYNIVGSMSRHLWHNAMEYVQLFLESPPNIDAMLCPKDHPNPSTRLSALVTEMSLKSALEFGRRSGGVDSKDIEAAIRYTAGVRELVLKASSQLRGDGRFSRVSVIVFLPSNVEDEHRFRNAAMWKDRHVETETETLSPPPPFYSSLAGARPRKV